jgi:hypothetical protein
MGAGSFPGVKCGRGVLLTTHPLLAPRSWKSRAIPLPPVWATTGPVTGLLYLYSPYLLNILVNLDIGDHIMALRKFVKNAREQRHRCVIHSVGHQNEVRTAGKKLNQINSDCKEKFDEYEMSEFVHV